MIAFLQKPREKRAANAVIVFEPVTVRAGAMWRAIKIARAALLIWGGVSLAGAAAAAMVLGRGGLEPYLQTVTASPVANAVAEPRPAPEPPEATVAVRQILPRSAEQPAVVAALMPAKPAAAARAAPSQATAAAAPAPPPSGIAALGSKILGPTRMATPDAAQQLPPATAGDVGDAAQNTEKEVAPLVIARLPRARPDEPRITGSIDRKYQPQSLRHFRRLREIPRRYQFVDPYAALPPYQDYRRLHPFFTRR